jgi:hypothetical protein
LASGSTVDVPNPDPAAAFASGAIAATAAPGSRRLPADQAVGLGHLRGCRHWGHPQCRPGQQVTFILGMTGTTLLGLLIARRAAIRWSPPTPITLCFVVLLNLALPTMAMWILHREGITGTHTIWTAAAVGAAIGVFSVGYGAVSQGRIQTQEELQDAVARLEASVNVLRQKAWG